MGGEAVKPRIHCNNTQKIIDMKDVVLNLDELDECTAPIYSGSPVVPNGIQFVKKRFSDYIQEGMDKEPIKCLFDEFWLENEICVLFSDSGVGKSILAVQVADSISKGIPINGFKLDTKPQTVLYFDFEMSSRQLAKRYSDGISQYEFSRNLVRLEVDSNSIRDDGLICVEEATFDALQYEIEKSGAKVVVIDNLTFLSQQSEDPSIALKMMKQFHYIKRRLGVSILIVSHTPKIEYGHIITKNDLQGSKNISNFCDSIVAIGKPLYGDNKVRYIKQLKSRDSEEKYGTNNVVVCRLDKIDNFLHFVFIETSEERKVMYKYGNRKEKPEPEIDFNTPYKLQTIIEILMPFEKIGTEEQKRERIRKRIQRGYIPYINKKGDMYFIDKKNLCTVG